MRNASSAFQLTGSAGPRFVVRWEPLVAAGVGLVGFDGRHTVELGHRRGKLAHDAASVKVHGHLHYAFLALAVRASEGLGGHIIDREPVLGCDGEQLPEDAAAIRIAHRQHRDGGRRAG